MTRAGNRRGRLRATWRKLRDLFAGPRLRRELMRTRRELRQLQRTGMALMTERDPDRLLERILGQTRRLTSSDAGSLYLVDETEDERRLRFKLSHNDSLTDLPFSEYTLALDTTSIAGYAAVTGGPLLIEDAYNIPDDAPYSFNHSFDERFGYRTRSMLVVPLRDHQGDLVGVLQLINRKREGAGSITSAEAADRDVVAYSRRDVEMVRSLAGHAAVSIENSRLYRRIRNIFESFVKASVIAIDQRDPSTAGHSVRVAALTTDLATALERYNRGEFAGHRFTRDQMRELRYAALLHDYGKVAVRESVLTKRKKLPPELFERVNARFALIRRTLEAKYHQRCAECLREIGREQYAEVAPVLEAEFRKSMAEIERFHRAVREANEPSVLPEESAAILEQIAGRTFEDGGGRPAPFLEKRELELLRIPKGSLDERERKEVESHVERTYQFLAQLPWTEDLRGVADIAYGHHEKLDGSGYPRGVTAEELPVQTRLMTIADIFDALTASDRPYKAALSADRALDILVDEARQGMLDAPLVELLIESELYRKIIERDWRLL